MSLEEKHIPEQDRLAARYWRRRARFESAKFAAWAVFFALWATIKITFEIIRTF